MPLPRLAVLFVILDSVIVNTFSAVKIAPPFSAELPSKATSCNTKFELNAQKIPPP